MWSNPRVPYELASKRKQLTPPNGKPIIVHVVMNVEYWPFDKNMPRGILPPPHGKSSDPPDLPNFSWVEYGMRVGLPRLMKLFYENVSFYQQIKSHQASSYEHHTRKVTPKLPYFIKRSICLLIIETIL